MLGWGLENYYITLHRFVCFNFFSFFIYHNWWMKLYVGSIVTFSRETAAIARQWILRFLSVYSLSTRRCLQSLSVFWCLSLKLLCICFFDIFLLVLVKSPAKTAQKLHAWCYCRNINTSCTSTSWIQRGPKSMKNIRNWRHVVFSLTLLHWQHNVKTWSLILSSEKDRATPQLASTENFVKFGHGFYEICERTDAQTNKQTNRLIICTHWSLCLA